MNTLSRAITAQILGDPGQFVALRQHWSGLIRSPQKHTLVAAHHLLYLALIGKDWRRAFTLTTNQRKIANGAYHGWKLFWALSALRVPRLEDGLLEPFDGLVTPLMLRQIREMIPYRHPYNYQPEQFKPGSFPFEAFVPIPETEPSGPEGEGHDA